MAGNTEQVFKYRPADSPATPFLQYCDTSNPPVVRQAAGCDRTTIVEQIEYMETECRICLISTCRVLSDSTIPKRAQMLFAWSLALPV